MKILVISFIGLLTICGCESSWKNQNYCPEIINDQLKKQIIAFHHSDREEDKTNVISLMIYRSGDTTVYMISHGVNLYQMKNFPPLFITRFNELMIVVRFEGYIEEFSVPGSSWEKLCIHEDPMGYKYFLDHGVTGVTLHETKSKLIYFYKGKQVK